MTDPERLLSSRIIDTLLREDYGQLAARVTRQDGSLVLGLPLGPAGESRLFPLEPDGFLADLRLRRASLEQAAGRPGAALTLDDVDALIAAVGDPSDQAGATAFAAECRQALASLRLRQRHLPAVRDRLGRAVQATAAARTGTARDPRSGPHGQLGYEALAATRAHPAYPTSAARLGLSDEDSLDYAPEYAPRFPLRWIAVPYPRLTLAGHEHPLPAGWPTMTDVGLPAALAATHHLLPVHPVTARDKLIEALAEAGLSDQASGAYPSGTQSAVLAPQPALPVVPTLSMRTVAVSGDPATHVKLPLPTSTLGLLNRRALNPGTLADGALVQGILATVRRDDPLLAALLLADESSYAHAAHPFLGYLLRRLPPGLEADRIVSIGALLAPSLDAGPAAGRPLVIEELARWAGPASPTGLFAAYLRQLFAVHVRLFARYGIALESHQQNAALVLRGPGGPPPPSQQASPDREEISAERCRLLVKDFDGALLHFPRLTAALGTDLRAESFADPRLLTTSDDALADVFITITVHLCAGALAFGLADRGVAPIADLLALVRRELTAALDRHAEWPATQLLRARVLDADRLPGKSMVTAGTLVAKSRTGASDINKFYGTSGPNYLKDVPMRSRR